MLGFKDIVKLKPSFKFGGLTMFDWFTINKGKGYCCISSGLRHADGETKSPYFCEIKIGGKNANKRALDEFNTWWNSIQK